MEWLTIDKAPEVEGKYFFCHLAWGPEEDRSTGNGFRWNGRWFAAATFYKGGPYDQCQLQIRQIEVTPSHFMELPGAPE